MLELSWKQKSGLGNYCNFGRGSFEFSSGGCGRGFNPLGGAEIPSEGGWSAPTQLQRVTMAIDIGASSRLLDPEE